MDNYLIHFPVAYDISLEFFGIQVMLLSFLAKNQNTAFQQTVT